MGYSRRRYQIRTKQNSSFGINITSMTDMFTIMLVFLLQTYATSETQITPEAGLRLPVSNSEANPVNALQMTLSKSALKIGDRTILQLQQGQIDAKDTDNRDRNFLPVVFRELKSLQNTQAPKDSFQKSIEEGRLLLLAESTLSYEVVRKVLYTASMAGFPKLKMATIVGE
ncbi:MAG: biopolymer transporter ExbD [Bdellovibrio sp.]